MNAYGWCLLRAIDPANARTLEPDPDLRDELTDRADNLLWAEFRSWMRTSADPFLLWNLAESNNNDRGVLTFSVSRNHRASELWDMLAWIVSHGPGSYGLVYVHDNEDVGRNNNFGRSGVDHSNHFRVHRLLHGEIAEMDDPFFDEVWPAIAD